MLEIRPTCKHCNKALSFNSDEAMICTFECTFCKDCVDRVLENLSPNCGGNFEKRPIRPKRLLKKYPVSTAITHQLVDLKQHQKRLNKI